MIKISGHPPRERRIVLMGSEDGEVMGREFKIPDEAAAGAFIAGGSVLLLQSARIRANFSCPFPTLIDLTPAKIPGLGDSPEPIVFAIVSLATKLGFKMMVQTT